MTETLAPVELVDVDAPLYPPEPEHLPDGSVCLGVLAELEVGTWTIAAFMRWLAGNGLPDRGLIADPGVWVYVDPDGARWVAVDYAADLAGSARRVRTNREAGRCELDHPAADLAARDRYVAPIVQPLPAIYGPLLVPVDDA